MDRLWSPWRYRYVTKAEPVDGCVFCGLAAARRDEESLILHRGERNFAILNLYPYTSGHMMIVPFEHVARLEDAAEETAAEMMRMARRAASLLAAAYKAPGLNIGMNIGECAGAGVAGHIHLHLLPRWPGDANFMTTTSETRVMPEEIAATYEKLRTGW